MRAEVMPGKFEIEIIELVSKAELRTKNQQYNEAMLYSRHAIECIVEQKCNELTDSGTIEITHSRLKTMMNRIKHKIPDQTHTMLQSINLMTRQHMHYQSDSSELNQKHVSLVIDTIKAVMTDLYPEILFSIIHDSGDDSELKTKLLENDAEKIRRLGFEDDISEETRIVYKQFSNSGLDLGDVESPIFSIDHLALAISLYYIGELSKAEIIFKKIIDNSNSSDTEDYVVSLRGMGRISRQRGNLDKAYRHYKKALDIYKSTNRIEKIWIMCELGDVERELGELEEAKSIFSECLNMAIEMENKRAECISRSGLADIYRQQGKLEEAEKLYNIGLKISNEIEFFQRQSSILGNLAEIARDRGDISHAHSLLEQSLDISQESEYAKGQAANLAQIAILYRIQENYSKSAEYYELSLDINKKIEHRKGESACLGGLAAIARRNDDLDTAWELQQRCLKISREIQNHRGIGINLAELGLIERLRGNFRESKRYYSESLSTNRKISYNKGIAMCLGNLAKLHSKKDKNKAIEFYEQSLEINRKTQHARGITLTLAQLGLLHFELDELEKAEINFSECRDWNKKIGDYKNESKAIAKLIKIARRNGDQTKAKLLEIERKRTWDLGNS